MREQTLPKLVNDGSFSFELEDDAFGSALIDFAVEVSAGPPRDKRCTPVNRSESLASFEPTDYSCNYCHCVLSVFLFWGLGRMMHRRTLGVRTNLSGCSAWAWLLLPCCHAPSPISVMCALWPAVRSNGSACHTVAGEADCCALRQLQPLELVPPSRRGTVSTVSRQSTLLFTRSQQPFTTRSRAHRAEPYAAGCGRERPAAF